MLNRILLSFLTIINFISSFKIVQNLGALMIFVFGLPLLPLLLEMKNLNNDSLKLTFLVHFILFFGFNYFIVRRGTKKASLLTEYEKKEVSLEWAILNVLIVQAIHSGAHYSIFKGYQYLLS